MQRKPRLKGRSPHWPSPALYRAKRHPSVRGSRPAYRARAWQRSSAPWKTWRARRPRSHPWGTEICPLPSSLSLSAAQKSAPHLGWCWETWNGATPRRQISSTSWVLITAAWSASRTFIKAFHSGFSQTSEAWIPPAMTLIIWSAVSSIQNPGLVAQEQIRKQAVVCDQVHTSLQPTVHLRLLELWRTTHCALWPFQTSSQTAPHLRLTTI